MNEKVKYINELFKYLTQNNDTEEYLTFFALLDNIKYNPDLLRYYGEEFVKNMIALLPRIEDKYDKASLIETIAQSFYWYSVSVNSCKEIFNEYVWCLREYATGVEDVVRCLTAFVRVGISKNEVVVKLVENLEKEYALRILSQIDFDVLNNIPEDTSKLLTAAKELSKISWRSGIIAQFLLLVHPHVRKYAGVSQITFLYDSYKGVYEDSWPRGLLPNRKETLIESKVLSIKEVYILERLDTLINTQEGVLDSMEVRKLYNDFFEGRDPFEVIFTLPM